MKQIEYGVIATLRNNVPANGGAVIRQGEQVTVGNNAKPMLAWWVQTTDGRKGVAFIEELQPV